MGTTGTAGVKLLLCSLLLMNEQREGEEGAISIRLLRGMGVTSAGAAPCRDRQALPDCHQPRCHLMPLALSLLYYSELGGSQGRVGWVTGHPGLPTGCCEDARLL